VTGGGAREPAEPADTETGWYKYKNMIRPLAGSYFRVQHTAPMSRLRGGDRPGWLPSLQRALARVRRVAGTQLNKLISCDSYAL
jgi:hypothetical protein